MKKRNKINKLFTRRWKKKNQRKIWNTGVEASFEIVKRWSRKIKFKQRLDGYDRELDWTF